MNTEKNIKAKLLSFFKLFRFLKLTDFDLQQKKDKLIENHKIFIRKKLFVQPINFTTFISILPFVLGFSLFLTQKYSSQRNNLFFEQNLPGIGLPTQKLNWDTFQYLFNNPSIRHDKHFLGQVEKNKVIWSDKEIIINNDYNDVKKLLTPFGEKNLIAYHTKYLNKYKKSKLITNSKWDKTFLFETEEAPHNKRSSYYINSFYQNLDEIPLKLEAMYESNTATKTLVFGTYINFAPKKSFSSAQKISKLILQNTGTKAISAGDKNILVAYKAKNLFETNNQNKEEFNTSSSIKSKNLISQKKQRDYFFNEYLLNREVRKLFNNNYISSLVEPSTKSSTFTVDAMFNKSLSSILKKEEISVFQEIIRQIDKISIPKPVNFTRLMSGYFYPDMSVEEVRSFILQKNTRKNWNLKILLPSSYLFPQVSIFTHLEPPEFLIESKKLLLTDTLHREPFYEGSTVVLNEETGFDWKIMSKSSTTLNTPKLRQWLEEYLGQKNPTYQPLKNFFGVLESPENLLPLIKHQSSNKNYWLDNLPIFKNGLIVNTAVNYLNFQRSFQLPTISKQEWQNSFLKNFSDLTSIQYNTAGNLVLPIFEVRTPKNQHPEIFFGYLNSLDFEFVHPFQSMGFRPNSISKFFPSRGIESQGASDLRFYRQSPSTSHYKSEAPGVQMGFPVSGSTFEDYHSFPIHLTSGNYRKQPSIFQNNSKVFFSDIWEPLTFKSWLITSQIGFAFLVFKVLKALADNYGRELLVYLLDLVALLGFLDDDLKQEIEILMGQREKGFRIISKIQKNFSNIAGIQNLLPEIVEIVWFLRNDGREFSISKTLPRGVLLTGPPGTGKTLLVQAIAGEAEVPVLALAGSSLLEPGESGALKLEILFQEARRVAPCIVFIDEMDTLAQKRDQVIQNPMGADEILESLSNIKPVSNLSGPDFKRNSIMDSSEEMTATVFAQQDTHKEKLRILMQFLVELDGIQGRDGVVVIGATNRPEILDAAILRPGRFDRILDLGLPGPEKRGEILKLYSENLGTNFVDKSITLDQEIAGTNPMGFVWNYVIQRTAGYSAADLAGIMNQSTLHAILKNTQHTIETIEHGIDRITTIGIEKPHKVENQKFLATQVAYYQAGKLLLSTLLEHHPPTLVTHLWPRRTNARAFQITENLQKYFFRFARRIELEHRIIGCYAGKAAEILFLQDCFQLNNLSDLGVEDIQFAQNLIGYMIDNWYFYGKTIAIQENSNILDIFNEKEYRDAQDKVPFLNSVLETNELSLTIKGEQFGDSSYSSNFLVESSIEQYPQKYFPTASWQYQISNEFELSTRTFSDWYRLYLPDPQQTERNLEWTPPDEFYHGNSINEKLTESVNWNELSNIKIDYEAHSLILQSFNQALVLLDQHREILDKLAYELLYSEILREPEVRKIIKQFNFELLEPDSSKDDKSTNINSLVDEKKPISKNWGDNSRRPQFHWISSKLIKD